MRCHAGLPLDTIVVIVEEKTALTMVEILAPHWGWSLRYLKENFEFALGFGCCNLNCSKLAI